MIRQYVYVRLALAQMTDHFDEIQSSGYSVSLFTDWQRQRISELWVKCRDEFDAPEEFFGSEARYAKSSSDWRDFGGELHGADGSGGALVRSVAAFPDGIYAERGEGAVNRNISCRGAMGSRRFWRSKGCGIGLSPHLLISEIWTIAADELWMSPCYRRDCRVWRSISRAGSSDWAGGPAAALPVIEKGASVCLGSRPHWGKLFMMAPRRNFAQRGMKGWASFEGSRRSIRSAREISQRFSGRQIYLLTSPRSPPKPSRP